MLPLTPSECYRLWTSVNQYYKGSPPDPFEFEDKVAEILMDMGFRPFQRRRVHGKSCANHEQDIVANKIGTKDFLFVECKTGRGVVEKRDVFSVFGKAFDIFNLAGRSLEIAFDGRLLTYYFDNVYCAIVSTLPLDEPAFQCSLALGILAVHPYETFENYASLPPALVEAYWLEICKREDIDPKFREDLSEFCATTFRSLLWSQREIFNGRILYKRLEQYDTRIRSLTHGLRGPL